MAAGFPPGAATRFRASLIGGDAAVTVAGTLLAAAGVGGFFAVARWFGPDAWVPILVLLVATAATVPLVRVVSGPDTRLRRILLVAFALKMLCTFPRFAMNQVVYDGASDASVYHQGGTALRANLLDEGRWSIEGSKLDAFGDETRFVGYVTGAVYLVTGASQFAGYLVFAWFSWLGLLCVFRAFQLTHPSASGRLAAGLVFFLPSTLYWPSSIGKDALMVFGIGAVTLGFARLVAGRPVAASVGLLALGGGLILQVRAHILLILLAGAAASLIARNASTAPTRGRILGRVVLLLALVPALVFGLARVDEAFGSSKDGGSLDLSAALEQAAGQTSIGGSAMETQPVRSPLDLPGAVVNVVFRPFLFEARSAPALISALEGTVLLGLTVASVRWLWRIGPAAYRNPFAAYCLGFVLAFVIAFTNIGNAGILARQRVQMFPLLMVLVAAAAEHRRLNATAPAADGFGATVGTSVPAHTDPRLVPIP